VGRLQVSTAACTWQDEALPTVDTQAGCSSCIMHCLAKLMNHEGPVPRRSSRVVLSS